MAFNGSGSRLLKILDEEVQVVTACSLASDLQATPWGK